MGYVPFIFFLSVVLTSTLGVTVNETDSTVVNPELEESQLGNTTRRGRHIQEIIEVPIPSKKTKRQVIKIPASVSKVKLVQPPLNLRHNRAPQQFNRYPSLYRSGNPWRPANKKSEPHFDIENSFPYDLKKVKRNLKKPIMKEVTPEEFYRDEEYSYEDRKHNQEKVKKDRPFHKVVKIKRKKPKHNVLGEFLVNYETDDSLNQEEGGFDSSKFRVEENRYGLNPAMSSIQIQQVPPPNLYPQNTPNQPYPMETNFGQLYDEKYQTGLKVEKLPTKGRQIQSLFSQQYTTHNPHVTTNFGLREVTQINGLQQGTKGSFEEAPYEILKLGKHNQQVVAASDQVVTAVPVKTPGIQVIQPPHFRDVTVSHPSHSSRLMSSLPQTKEETLSQKATIRDILEQDCPSFDTKGYCDSPPRYPMQQIKKIVKKCANLMDAMNTQAFDEPHEVYGFAKRSDDNGGRDNKSLTLDTDSESPSSWSRSATEGLTACISDLELTEPGYAKEVNSGRWFVIVQHPDTTIQRIATDTCKSPGKSCGGLSEMKCTKTNTLLTKSTKCVQRHTHQRLISWDPESPEECPRMRLFRFPSACVCHLGII